MMFELRSNFDRSLLLIIVSASFLNCCGFENKYCELACDYFPQKTQHTVCLRQEKKCGPSPKCGQNFREIHFSDDDRQYILDIHNYLRNRVALGLEKRNYQPSATNMNIMSYNRELEFIAQCWANACNGSPLTHDKCRRTENYGHVGQNLGFINSSVPDINVVKTIKELILLWYDEVGIFNNTWIRETLNRGPSVKVGHYTQMVWSQSFEIGCAASFYIETTDKIWYNVVFVCNYGPGGNYLGLPVYETGPPASNCPVDSKPNKFYRGLCGDSIPLNKTLRENFNVFNTF